MPSLEHSAADHPSCSPLRFVKRGHSRSAAIAANFEKEYGVSDLNATTDSESDSDESSDTADTYFSQPLSVSTAIDRSHWSIYRTKSLVECNADTDRIDHPISETDCDSDDLQTQHRNTRYKRRVNFAVELENVLEIPSHRILDPKMKEDLYTNMRVIHAEAIRNRKEWDFELRNVQNVVEEFDFIPDCNGNLWHPAHWNPVI